MKKSENVQNQLEAQKNMLEKLSKTLDDQNKAISLLTSLIDEQNKFIKMMDGKLEKNDSKKSSQNKIYESKKTNRSRQLQDSIATVASEIAEQDKRISELRRVVANNQNKICSTNKKLDKYDLLTLCYDKLAQSSIHRIYKFNKKEVFGFISDCLPCSWENGNKSIFQNQSNLGYKFNFDIPSCDNQDYQFGEDEK